MPSLPDSSSPQDQSQTTNDKNETSRFLGEGVSFKAKLIGILEVSEARGDRMCQEALADLKMAIRAAGEHKQRITINIAIDGLRLRDEKTGDSLYHHPVHKISFIAQDMSDSRAFGYIFGSPDTGHRFFGIKTDKAASQVVIAMRDLFQVVFALKKKEIELAKQHLDKSRFSTSPLFSERSLNSKSNLHDIGTKSSSDAKGAVASSSEQRSTPAVADLVDLELELNSLQQGLTQMERITPSDPFGRNEDPFGDSFTSFSKGILPPPPSSSSGRDRSARVSESSSIFSPKTPHNVGGASCDSSSAADLFNSSRDTPKDFSFNEFNSSHDEPSSGDWFTPPAGNSLFEDAPSSLTTASEKDRQHEQAKADILSQFDVFTELDPLGTKNFQNNQTIGTGKVKPYVDKKHFFQELKNPPKKVLNDLVSEATIPTSHQPISIPMESHSTQSITTAAAIASFPTFDQQQTSMNKSSSSSIYNNDPFGEDPFDQTDPFADDDFGKQQDFKVFENDLSDYKLFNSSTSTITNSNANLNTNSSYKLNDLSDKNLSQSQSGGISGDLSQLFKADFEFNASNTSTTRKLFDHQSFDISSESEAPDPPPRPTNTLLKPPPLPPKKQATDLSNKPPPRPPQESHYDYMDKYESGKVAIVDDSPPLPAPARKPQEIYANRFESDFVTKEDEYLTPIGILPPPKSTRKTRSESPSVYVPVTATQKVTQTATPSTTGESGLTELTLDTLDITLSQLTLSGLNELASKLNIPASQLSNMTLVQLTNYLSNFIKNKNQTPGHSVSPTVLPSEADFADFNQFNKQSHAQPANIMSAPSYDRYAAFRELLQEEEIRTTKIDDYELPEAEPQPELEVSLELQEENDNESPISPENQQNDLNVDFVSISARSSGSVDNDNDAEIIDAKAVEIALQIDRYAALREIIVETDVRSTEDIDTIEEDEEEEEEDEAAEADADLDDNHLQTIDEVVTEQNNINDDKSSSVENDLNTLPIADLIIDDVKNDNTTTQNYDTDLVQNQLHRQSNVKELEVELPKSASLSDVVSGSSPEIEDTAEVDTEVDKKDATGESWAIFDHPNLIVEEAVKETKAVQSEEGVSPWSSDSKEFGNGSPVNWRARRDSESGDHWTGPGLAPGLGRGRTHSQEGWWDTSAEPETPYYNPRRSTDSFDDDCYDCYDRPRRTRRGNWCAQPTGGHSSSSRDVSPWEEEPRRARDGRASWTRHSRQSFERDRHRRHDSWDEEDDYEYEDERFHWHSERPHPHIDEWEDRRMRTSARRRDVDRERWCCPDYDAKDLPEPPSRYSSGRWSNPERPERRKHDDRYYARDAQESPWEDEYGNEMEPHYLTRRTRIRPSSATEMDRKTGEIKSRQFHLSHGSDGERERRYKTNRRSKSRDSQYSEPPSLRLAPSLRGPTRKPHSKFEDYEPTPPKTLLKEPPTAKKSNTLVGRKARTKESSKTEDTNTFPRKARTETARSMFENDFVQFDEFPERAPERERHREREREDKWYKKPAPPKQPQQMPPMSLTRYKQKSLFEDDFSPSDKEEKVNLPPTESMHSSGTGSSGLGSSMHSGHSGSGIGMNLKDELAHADEAADCLGTNNFDTRNTNNSKKRLNRIAQLESNLKKSESVNIFTRENDPFDDDFFSAENANGDGKWAHHFDDNRT